MKQGAIYRLEVSGRWRDWFIPCDARGPLCLIPDLLMLPARPLLRFSPARDLGTKFFVPVGLIGRPDEARVRNEGFVVRDGMRICPRTSGRLHVFANDWNSRAAYGNNAGALTLLVIEECAMGTKCERENHCGRGVRLVP